MLIREQPLPGESLSSFLMRGAQSNGFLDTQNFLMALFRSGEMPESWLPALSSGENGYWAGCDADEPPRKNNLGGRFMQAYPRHFCPDCLEEGGYWRRSWEYTFVAFCPRHRVWLEDRCAACKSRITFWCTAPNCSKCGERLRFHQQRDLIADEKALTLAQILARSAEQGSWTPDLVDIDVPWKLPSPLGYEDLSRLVLLIGGYAIGRNGKPRKISFKDDAHVIRGVITRAAHALLPWPAAFHDLLGGLRDAGRTSLTGKMSYFYKALYTEFRDTNVEFLRQEVEEYLKNNWDGVFNRRHTHFSESLLRSQRMQSVTVVAKHQRIPRRVLIDAIRDQRIEGTMEVLPSGRIRAAVRADLLDGVAAQLEFLSLAEVAKVLGLSQQRVKELISAGLIEGRIPFEGRPWAIPAVELSAFCQRLEAMASPAPHDILRAKPLSYVSRYFPAARQAFSDFLAAVLAGDVPVFLQSSHSQPIFTKLHITVGALREWQLKMLGYLSVPHAAELLGLKQEVAYHLFRRGLLVASSVDAGCPAVTAEDICAFQQRYVLATELIGNLAGSSRAVIRTLASLGVLPVSGPDVDGGRQNVFERAAVAEAYCPVEQGMERAQ